MHRAARRQRQKGAVIVTVAFVLLFLLGFLGVALDFGRLFVVKSELQTAMDSCALAAAQELDGQANAITRARNAGKAAGNFNRVNFQSTTWSGQVQITDADITFMEGSPTFTVTASDSLAVYARCAHTHPGVQLWLLHAFGATANAQTSYANTQNVWASAVATRAPAQTTCPIPVALRPKDCGGAPCTGPDYGFVKGEWVKIYESPSLQDFGPGNAGWANMDGTSGATETKAEMNGKCGVKTDDDVTPGSKSAVKELWNFRFGIYGQNEGPSNFGTPGSPNDPNMRPDFTGYSYTQYNAGTGQGNWLAVVDPATNALMGNAWDGDKATHAQHATADNFLVKRAAFASCGDTTTNKSDCESITDLNLPGGVKKLSTPGVGVMGGHWQYGASRRVVLVPVLKSAVDEINDFACMLMLHPMTNDPNQIVYLEYLGNAGGLGVPCTTAGLPGGTAGPKVPTLVR